MAGKINAKEIIRKGCIVLGEMIATMILVWLGCMGCVSSPNYSNSHLQACLTFGFVVFIAIQCFGCISGAHINPAVTLAFYIYEMMSLPMAIAYFFAQLIGAVLGYGLLKASLPYADLYSVNTPSGVCITTLGKGITIWQGVLIEFVITSFLIMVCCAVWDPRNAKFGDSVSLRFGIAVGCLALAAGPFTGASMNPARTFGPAVWNNFWEYHWIYWVSPMVSSALTAFLWKYAFKPTGEKPDEDEA
ncbi:aquaporin-like [Drosophila sulfurigaster albostrigata]|uniref:aquaporin-like n=1 Tax=Drosophila sulfurigaster albostrigata TaxID=89887 RepID=UPI002D21A926|nr:aquaporin-like [Drosophila sulfurigaster albostrigata]